MSLELSGKRREGREWGQWEQGQFLCGLVGLSEDFALTPSETRTLLGFRAEEGQEVTQDQTRSLDWEWGWGDR